MSLYNRTRLIHLTPILIVCTIIQTLNGFGTITRNDPFPMFTSLDPQTFLYTRERNLLKGWPIEKERKERAELSISPFGQNAVAARDINNNDIEIGELNGRWDLLTLLFGPTPAGRTLPPALLLARQAIFPNLPPGTIINEDAIVDTTNQQVGFVSVPVSYRKRGIRVEIEGQIWGDFGLQFHGGLADISQIPTFTTFPDAVYPTTNVACITFPDVCEINKTLVDQLCTIAKQLGLNIDPFHELSIEDLWFFLYWRHAHPVNFNRDESWPKLLVIPFFRIGGSVAAGKDKKPCEVFGLPFGNNGSNGVMANAGISFDFADTIEVGAEAGYAHYFEHDFCDFRIPTSCYQSGLFPFGTDVTISPGATWYFGAKMNAYHFIDRLSFYFEYIIVQHLDDHIKLLCCDPAFRPRQLEDKSTWKVKLFNAAFNYDISPNIGLGVLWQQPLAWLNAYKSTTLLFTFYASF